MRRGLGLAGRWYAEACGPGGAGCAIGRLSWHAQSLARRGCEAAGAGGEAGVEASGEASEAKVACGVGAGRAGASADVEMRADEANRERSRDAAHFVAAVCGSFFW